MTRMPLRYARTLITGTPGVGKTTLIRKLVARLHTESMAGFTTQEIRSGKKRCGFELRGLDGRRGILAHVDLKRRQRVGRYGVDTAGFDAFLQGLDLLHPRVALVVIDEIGKMELFSSRFQTLVRRVLDSDKSLLASVARRGGGLIREVKQRTDVHLVDVTPGNRDHLITTLVD